MTTLDVPRDGRATFHRLSVRALLDMLLADERTFPASIADMPRFATEIIETYLRPRAYLARGIGT